MTEFKACKDCRFYAKINAFDGCSHPKVATFDVITGKLQKYKNCLDIRGIGGSGQICGMEAKLFEPVERAPPQRAVPRGEVYETLDESAECNCETCFFINYEAEDEPCASCDLFDKWTACPPPRKGDSE